MGSQGRTAWVFCFLCTAANILAFTHDASAAPDKLRLDPVDISACPNLKAFVSVEDESGNLVGGVVPGAFGAVVDGQPVGKVEATTFTESGEGLAVALVLDTSGSMAGEPMAAQNQAASAFIGKLKAADHVAVITFGNTVQVVRAFSKPAPDIRRQVESLAVDSEPESSKLYDGIYKALDEVRDATGLPAHRTVVVISDGKDVGSSVTLEDCQRLAKATRSTIHSIGFSQIRGDAQRRGYLANLDRLARVTGGVYQEAPGPNALSGLYSGLIRRLMGRYVLKFLAHGLNPDGKSRELRVTLDLPSGKLTKVREFTIPKNHSCPRPPPPQPTPPDRTRIYLAAGGSAALLLLIAGVLLVRRSRKKRELAARTCNVCGEVRPDGTDDCPVCQPVTFGAGASDATRIEQEGTGQEPIAQLVILSGGPENAKGYVFDLAGDTTVIGRNEERCQVLLPDVNVSSIHARINLVADGFEIHDLRSANGTRLNGKQIDSASLSDGDELGLGNMELKFFDRRK